jgi:hypothetical protein
MRSAFIVFLTCALAACATPQQTASPRRQSRPLGADTETQKAAFDLIQITLICLAHNKPIHPGKIILAGVFAEPGAPVKVFDSESTPGNERGIACAAEQAYRVKSPRSPPSRFVWYYIVFPGGPKDIRIMFPPDEPPHKLP